MLCVLSREMYTLNLDRLHGVSVLIVHHLEPHWEPDYKKYSSNLWDFYTLCEATAKHIRRKKYDHVILTQFQHTPLTDHPAYYPLFNKIHAQYEYGYGWDVYDTAQDPSPENIDKLYDRLERDGHLIDWNGTIWARGGAHSEVVLIDNWMQALPKRDVSICGAFDGSCVEDLEHALQFLKIEYNRVEELII